LPRVSILTAPLRRDGMALIEAYIIGYISWLPLYVLGMSRTRDHVAMEKLRQKAGQLFAKEYSVPEVARRLGVARQVAFRWKNA
jgi:hypothetical protein